MNYVKKVLKPIFSKKILGAVMLIAQILIFAVTVDKLYKYRVYIYGFSAAMSIALIVWEINRNVDPGFKIIWIALIAGAPFFGILLYFYVHLDVFMRGMKKQLDKNTASARQYAASMTRGLDVISEKHPEEAGIFRYLYNQAAAPCFSESKVEYFKIGEEMYRSLCEDMKRARKYIFLEFFILNQNSGMWKNIHDILKKKVSEGVEIRVMYDGMGSLTCTSNEFDKMLISEGIQCRIFSPVKPFLSTYHNNRDHRKIIVIDGEIAYTGGINIADEYINTINRFGHWKDTAVKVTGDGVAGFVMMYIKLWDLFKENKTNCSDYISDNIEAVNTNGFIAPFDDNPMDNEAVVENVYLHMINTSKKYVHITTPYLILDDDLADSLKFAAKRGVDVKIIMPHIPDKWYAFALARTYYPELIKAGVKVYEYTPGFVHAKSTVADGERAFVGSANYDFRSLYLHYECGVYIYGNGVIDDIEADFESTLKKCGLFTLRDYKRLGVFYRLAGRVFRIFAPLM